VSLSAIYEVLNWWSIVSTYLIHKHIFKCKSF